MPVIVSVPPIFPIGVGETQGLELTTWIGDASGPIRVLQDKEQPTHDMGSDGGHAELTLDVPFVLENQVIAQMVGYSYTNATDTYIAPGDGGAATSYCFLKRKLPEIYPYYSRSQASPNPAPSRLQDNSATDPTTGAPSPRSSSGYPLYCVDAKAVDRLKPLKAGTYPPGYLPYAPFYDPAFPGATVIPWGVAPVYERSIIQCKFATLPYVVCFQNEIPITNPTTLATSFPISLAKMEGYRFTTIKFKSQSKLLTGNFGSWSFDPGSFEVVPGTTFLQFVSSGPGSYLSGLLPEVARNFGIPECSAIIELHWMDVPGGCFNVNRLNFSGNSTNNAIVQWRPLINFGSATSADAVYTFQPGTLLLMGYDATPTIGTLGYETYTIVMTFLWNPFGINTALDPTQGGYRPMHFRLPATFGGLATTWPGAGPGPLYAPPVAPGPPVRPLKATDYSKLFLPNP